MSPVGDARCLLLVDRGMEGTLSASWSLHPHTRCRKPTHLFIHVPLLCPILEEPALRINGKMGFGTESVEKGGI